ncbi:hypothetical protein [uncultured Xanthomonas sp.]|uniref:hypothetical protein n=1 Tax=uncultured Xanthomonas sp. TaxID=152831 RepID=UPI0025DC8BF2|nr:hypothetical protein [uncultured Xanthomonas sp.]
MSLTYRSPTASDILHVAANMRQEDILEVAASHGHTPLQALAYATTASHRSFAAVWMGVPVCIFGFTEHAEGITSVWLLGTDDLVSPAVRRVFLREARRITSEWADTFGCIFNYVDVHAEHTRKWLAWLGFIEHGIEPEYGFAAAPFVRVIKTSCATP